MEISERQQRWRKQNTLTPKKLELAHRILDEIREGNDVMRALRSYPLDGGGYLTKAALITAYHQWWKRKL